MLQSCAELLKRMCDFWISSTEIWAHMKKTWNLFGEKCFLIWYPLHSCIKHICVLLPIWTHKDLVNQVPLHRFSWKIYLGRGATPYCLANSPWDDPSSPHNPNPPPRICNRIHQHHHSSNSELMQFLDLPKKKTHKNMVSGEK